VRDDTASFRNFEPSTDMVCTRVALLASSAENSESESPV
jgi:hypothetical protein